MRLIIVLQAHQLQPTLILQVPAYSTINDITMENPGTKKIVIHTFVQMGVFLFSIIAIRLRKFRQRIHQRHSATVKTATSIIMARFGRKMSVIITFAKMVQSKL